MNGMISSVPLIAPRDAHSLWYTPSRSFALTPPPGTPSTLASPGVLQNLSATELNQNRQNQNQQRRMHISPLAQLILDEQQVEQRKLHIQRFGATWIRPPGVQKTMQGEDDEKAEKAEIDRLASLEGEPGADDELVDVEGDEDQDQQVGVRAVGNMIQDVEENGEVGGEEDLDDQIPEGESFEEEDVGTDEEGIDLDEQIPEAEADYDLRDDFDDSDDGEEEEEQTLAATVGRRLGLPRMSLPSPPSGGAAMVMGSSPGQAMFSHDDRFSNEESFASTDMREYTRRYNAALASEDDEMEVDSDS